MADVVDLAAWKGAKKFPRKGPARFETAFEDGVCPDCGDRLEVGIPEHDVRTVIDYLYCNTCDWTEHLEWILD